MSVGNPTETNGKIMNIDDCFDDQGNICSTGVMAIYFPIGTTKLKRSEKIQYTSDSRGIVLYKSEVRTSKSNGKISVCEFMAVYAGQYNDETQTTNWIKLNPTDHRMKRFLKHFKQKKERNPDHWHNYTYAKAIEMAKYPSLYVRDVKY